MNVALKDYLDVDVSYLLGLIIGRGTLLQDKGLFVLTIEFPFKNLQVQGISRVYKQDEAVQLTVYRIRERVASLIGTEVQVISDSHSVILKTTFVNETIALRDLRLLLGGLGSYRNFKIHENLFICGDHAVQKEFVRGIAEVCGFIRTSNRERNGRHRVYIEIHHDNWSLPVQLCRLLQEELNVSVQLIQWGHPNTRTPFALNSKAWKKEHQLKVFADEFTTIGFYAEYKNEILSELARANRTAGHAKPTPCDPTAITRLRRKPKHPSERDKSLPKLLRSKHFDGYREICRTLGCNQCFRTDID